MAALQDVARFGCSMKCPPAVSAAVESTVPAPCTPTNCGGPLSSSRSSSMLLWSSLRQRDCTPLQSIPEPSTNPAKLHSISTSKRDSSPLCGRPVVESRAADVEEPPTPPATVSQQSVPSNDVLRTPVLAVRPAASCPGAPKKRGFTSSSYSLGSLSVAKRKLDFEDSAEVEKNSLRFARPVAAGFSGFTSMRV